jgi:PASTA domain-containing protein
MNFEHLDDTMPVEPDERARAAVTARARRLRQRRAIVPGTVLLVLAGVTIAAVAMLSNESTVPSRVVAGPTTTTAAAPEPIGAAVTRGDVHVEASIPDATVAPGSTVPVRITATTSGNRSPLPVRVCIVDPPIGNGWTGFDPGASCTVHEVMGGSPQFVELPAPRNSGDYAVFLRWSAAPSGDFLPIPLHVVGRASAQTSVVQVPNVVGMSVDTAIRRLQTAGLGVETHSAAPLNAERPGIVIAMNPDAASRVIWVPRGTTITLTVSWSTP